MKLPGLGWEPFFAVELPAANSISLSDPAGVVESSNSSFHIDFNQLWKTIDAAGW